MWRPYMREVDCLQASRNARERAGWFFSDAAVWCAICSSESGHPLESWQSFETYLDMAFAELEIAHYWLERAARC